MMTRGGEFFSKSRVWDNIPEGRILILEIPEFSYNTALDKLQETPVPTTSSSSSAVSVQYRLVTNT